jgi:hypothetical protein
MFKRLMVLVIGLSLCVSAARAQDVGWNAWLYEPDGGQLILVDETGAVQRQLILPIDIAFDSYSYNVTLSRSAKWVAYVITSSTSYESQLRVYDINANTLDSFTLPRLIADSIGFSTNSLAFNDADSALAYGYSADDGGGRGHWDIGVFDLATGSTLFNLASSDSVVAAAGIRADQGWTPIVESYQGGKITFVMGLSGTEGQPVNQGYTWDPASNTLQPNVAYPTFTNDTFVATGEVIMPMMDERLPNEAASLPIPYQQNTVQVYDPVTQSRFPFFADPKWNINAAYFVQNGQRILISALNLEDQTSLDPRFWALLERDGTLVGNLPMPPEVTSVHGLLNGFIYTTNTTSTEGTATALMVVDTTVGLDVNHVVWSSAVDEKARIIWASDRQFQGQASLTFRPWARLADSVTAQQGISPLQVATSTPFVGGNPPLPVPTATPIISGILTIGQYATVNTTAGDQLNVRSGPGMTFAIVAKVRAGTAVLLLEGPRSAGGFVWWRIRIPSGVEGWVVESVDDNGTRLRTLIP